MSSLVRHCSLVLFAALTLSTQVKAESHSADLSSSKVVGASLRAYTIANPETKELISNNLTWTRTQITNTKKFVGSKDLSKAMKLKAASDTYTLLMNALIRLSPAISDADVKKAARDRLIAYKKVVATHNIDAISKSINVMETEITSAIDAYNAL